MKDMNDPCIPIPEKREITAVEVKATKSRVTINYLIIEGDSYKGSNN